MTRALTAALVTAAASSLWAQSAPDARQPGRSDVITGRVLSSDGDPLRNARVRGGSDVVLTDADGGFTLTSTQPRRPLSISKAGYATREVAAAGGIPLSIKLQRGAAIGGRVLDVTGEPVVDITVQLVSKNGQSTAPQTVRTDDLGEYRFGSLAAGTYTVTAAGLMTAVVTVGPGLAAPVQMNADTQTITVTTGEEKALDFTTRASAAPVSVPPLVTIAGTTPTRGSAGVHGRIVARDGHPIAYAQVQLDPAERGFARSTTANVDGDFGFNALPPGRYRLRASRTGYSDVSAPTQVALKEDAPLELNLVLDRDGVIAGIISDEAGEPLQGVTVQALRARAQRGQRQLAPAGLTRITDDHGAYRLFGLMPGDYVITAVMNSTDPNAVRGYVRSYYPGTDDSTQAQLVTLAAARVMSGANIWLARARTARIRGRILNAAGEPTTGGRVALMPSQHGGAFVAIPTNATLSGEGLFEFSDVPAGQYVIQADRGRRNASTEGEFGALPVTVDGRDLSNLVVQMSTGSTLRGQVTLHPQNSATAPAPAAFEISAVPADFDDAPPQWASASPNADGVFEMHGIHGSRRLQVLRPPTGWIVESIRVDGVDATDTPVTFNGASADVDVVVTDRAAAVFGTVTDTRGSVVEGAHVIFFAANRNDRYPDSRYFARTTSQSDGTFSIAALPAGRYYAAAVASLSEGEDGWQDPQVLEALEARAESVTLSATATISVRLRLTGP